jgi:hypothetical protein
MNVEQSLTQIINLVRTWAKRIASLGLAVFVLLVVARLYGLPTYVAIPNPTWELGVLMACIAFVISGTGSK